MYVKFCVATNELCVFLVRGSATHFFVILGYGIMKERTCCFTGHRTLPQGLELLKLKKHLKSSIIDLIENHNVCFFGNGGALGFDTLAAQTVINLKTKYPQIKLIMVLPCKNQDKYWKEKDVEIYNFIKSKADKIVYTSETYSKDCMLKRNRHLVDNSKYCICYLHQNTGGTAYTVKYAQKNNLEIINL